MALVDLNLDPSTRQLRQFGLIAVVGFAAAAWAWGGDTLALIVASGIGVVCGLLGWLAPQSLKFLFIGLSLITWPIGVVVGELALLLIYFGLFLPFGLFFRLRGRDVLRRKLDRNASSYWEDRPTVRPPTDYYRQS